MNAIFLNDENGEILDHQILNHIHTTLKLKVGDTVKIIIHHKGIGLGSVISLSSNFCKIKIEKIHQGQKNWFDLIVGISRPQTTKKILEHATTFGANSFHFYKATLSEKSYLDSKVFETQSMNDHLISGLSQSTIYQELPKVKTYQYNPAEQFKDFEQKFILDIKGNETFLDYKIDFNKPIALSIGPERGFIQEDLTPFKNAGFKSIKISPTVLRVEHAIYAAISQLELLKGPLC